MTTELSVCFAGGQFAAASARRALGALRALIGPQRLDDVQLLVSELVTNGVRHAGAADSSLIELTVLRAGDRLRVEVSDPGTGFAGDAHPGMGDETGGWGLYLVDQLADSWGAHTTDAGHQVWFEVGFSPVGPIPVYTAA